MINLLEELFQRFHQSRLLVQLLNGSDVAVGVRTLDGCVTENTSNLKKIDWQKIIVYVLNVFRKSRQQAHSKRNVLLSNVRVTTFITANTAINT